MRGVQRRGALLNRVLQRAAVLPQVDQLFQSQQQGDQQQVVEFAIHGGFQRQDALTQHGVLAGTGSTGPLQPLRDVGDQRFQPRRQLAPTGAQSTQPVGNRRQHRQHQQHALAQPFHRYCGPGVARIIATQELDQRLELHQVGGQTIARCMCLAAQQDLPAPLCGIAHPAADARTQHGLDGGGEKQRGEQHRHHRAQDDFLAARHHGVEDGVRRGHRREADEGGGVTGQQEGVATRAAVEQGDEQAGRQPQRHRRAQQQRCFHQVRQHPQRGCTGNQRADDAVRALGPGRAQHRLGDDVHSGHRPVRARQVAGQADVQRGQRGQEGLDRERPGLAVQQQHGVTHSTRAPPRRRRSSRRPAPGTGGSGHAKSALQPGPG